MKKTLIVMSTNRGLHPETLDAVRALRNAGARLVQQSGASDVSLARNHALSIACRALEQPGATDIDTILMVDDDMVFSVDDAQRLVDRTRETRAPASGCYVQKGGQPAASAPPKELCSEAELDKLPGAVRAFLGNVPIRPGSWLVGLGFLAFPVVDLVDLRSASTPFVLRGETMFEFVRSSAIVGHWISEDYCLSARLGGVELMASIPVGHLKTVALYPAESILEKVATVRIFEEAPHA